MSSIERSIEVAVPVGTAYNQWTQFEEFPRFMEGVEEVRQLDDTHLHWRAEVGLKDKEWEAEIVEQVPDQRIAWRSTTGAENGGIVTFQSLAPHQTMVTLQLHYAPEGFLENVGDTLGVVSRRVDGDLRRFKEFVEARGTATGGWRGAIQDSGPTSSTEATGAPDSTTGAVYDHTVQTTGSVNETVVPIVEENLRVGKQLVETGGVRINTRVTEAPVDEQVQLRDEHAHVERRPVDRPASEADFVPDGTLEVRELHEHPVVERQARVVEEVVVSKQTQPRVETVQDTVRRGDVVVEQLPGQTTTAGSIETGLMTAGDVAGLGTTGPTGVRATTTETLASTGRTSVPHPADISTTIMQSQPATSSGTGTVQQRAGAARPAVRRDVGRPTSNALSVIATSLRQGDIRVALEALRASVHRHPLRSVAIGLGLGYLARRTFAGGSGAQSRVQSSARGGMLPPAPPRAVPVSAALSGPHYGAGAAPTSARVMPVASGTSGPGAPAIRTQDTLEARLPEAARDVTRGTLAADVHTTTTSGATLGDLDARLFGTDAGAAALYGTESATIGATPTSELPAMATHSAGAQVDAGSTQNVMDGGARLTTSVEHVPASAQVTLRDEHAHVERRPVDRPASEADFVPDGTLEVRELHEHPVVERQARVVEEVVVNIQEHTAAAQDTAYRTDVSVERIGGERSTTDDPATDLGTTEQG